MLDEIMASRMAGKKITSSPLMRFEASCWKGLQARWIARNKAHVIKIKSKKSDRDGKEVSLVTTKYLLLSSYNTTTILKKKNNFTAKENVQLIHIWIQHHMKEWWPPHQHDDLLAEISVPKDKIFFSKHFYDGEAKLNCMPVFPWSCSNCLNI